VGLEIEIDVVKDAAGRTIASLPSDLFFLLISLFSFVCSS